MNEADRREGRPARPAGSARQGGAKPAVARVRLVDVAREAGLSKTTVSAALNGTGRLSDAVREHARETARRLGYRPNATARLLRAGHTRLIGFAVREYVAGPWAYMELPYFTQLTNATATAALEHGHALVLLPNHSPRDEWADLPLDAICLVDPVVDDPLVDDFLAAGIPVLTDRRVEGRPGGYWVDIDYDAAMRSVLDHLAEQGATDIAMVTAGLDTLYTRRYLAAQEAWSAETGRRVRVAMVDRPGVAPTLAAIGELLGGAGPGPDALFVLNEVSPTLILDCARRHGRRVPDDLLVVCATEDSTAEHTDPPVSALSMQPALVAVAGVELLVEVLDKGLAEPRGTEVATRLDIRASSLASARTGS
ncbi:LacI family DNA-binding transcriptional regulator [Yinghuangia soli]|uniref:LacI family transcriptional regulator n=1 Tax=Yinghuangia soli TaxID=2908204 RepID=A0AA41PYN4_9ACTN|nr:LacI family DNA-binding transcriptional regulator [Yinghuangia soli]MCF2527586.1 LacI family transcriptional regulator [Yinghuangia soli]